eukprot:640927-Pleurochrysis_carterae.AAC.1
MCDVHGRTTGGRPVLEEWVNDEAGEREHKEAGESSAGSECVGSGPGAASRAARRVERLKLLLFIDVKLNENDEFDNEF